MPAKHHPPNPPKTGHHSLQPNPDSTFTCTKCKKNFPKTAWGDCPGVPQYPWSPWPDPLRTAQQLAAVNLTPGPKRGALWHNTYRRWIWLYDPKDATPK